MPLPFLALDPVFPRPIEIYYQAAVTPCVIEVGECVSCYTADPFILQPDWDSLTAQASMTPIPIYGSLGFDEYALES